MNRKENRQIGEAVSRAEPVNSHERRKPSPFFIPWRHLLIILVCGYFLFFFRMGAHDLWSPDEPRYAQVAREMLRSNDWVVPHLNGEVYTEKPPLYFWLIALASKPFGDVNEMTARMPSAVSALLTMLLTYLLGANLLGRREALLGTLIMATSAQFIWIGRIGVLDMLLALCILATLCLFYAGYANKKPFLYVTGFLFLAPAALTKGPVGIAIPLVVMLTFLIVEVLMRQEGAKRQLLLFCLSLLAGLGLILAIVGPWWRAAYERSGGVYGSASILLKQTRGRMMESYSHRQPLLYYFYNFLWQFIPWTVFLPLSAYALKKIGNPRANRGLRFLLVWFISIFIFFTVISGKRSQYVLPLFPAASLLMGWALSSWNPFEVGLKDRKAFKIPLLLLAIGFAITLIGFPVIALFMLRDFFIFSLAGAATFAILLILAIPRLNVRPPIFALASLVAATTLLVVAVFGYVAPAVDTYKSARPFCMNVQGALADEDAVFFYKVYRPNINYYMGRNMKKLDSIEDARLALEGRQKVFLVLQYKHLDSLAAGDSLAVEQIARNQIGSRDMVCVKLSRAVPSS